jgi:cell wall-associated NlpC family hydrolase
VAQLPSAHRSPGRSVRGRRGFGRCRSLLALVAAVAVALVPSVPAQAEPTLEQIEKQIDEQWEQLEATIEQYNKVRSELKVNRKKAKELAKKIEPLALQADLAESKIAKIATAYYKTGPTSNLNALLASGSATTLADQLSFLDRIARDERAQIAAVIELRDAYRNEKRKLDDLIALQAKQDAELGKKKKHINAEMDRLQEMRLAAYGTTSVGGALRTGPCPAIYPGGAAAIVVKEACAQIGKPYVWGATGPSAFDCSGLTQWAWAKVGVHLTHYTGAQWNEGVPVSRADLRPGDLVFFHSDLRHVGIYVGNNTMVHAPTTGDVVRMASLDVLPIAGFRRPG